LSSKEAFGTQTRILAANLPPEVQVDMVNAPAKDFIGEESREGCRALLQHPPPERATVKNKRKRKKSKKKKCIDLSSQVQTIYGNCGPQVAGVQLHCLTAYMFFDQQGTAKFAFIHISTDPKVKKLPAVGPVHDYSELMAQRMERGMPLSSSEGTLEEREEIEYLDFMRQSNDVLHFSLLEGDEFLQEDNLQIVFN
jgi:hypothetical protein